MRRSKVTFISISFLLSLLVSLGARAQDYSTPFDRAREAPAYFAGSSSREAAAIRKEIESIIHERMNRMTIPVPSGNGREMKRVRFVEWAKSEANKLGYSDRLRLYPSGGLIRNNIGQIYEEIHSKMAANPKGSVLVQLREMRARMPSEIFHSEIRGVMSDFDVLLGGLNETELNRFNHHVQTKITNFEDSTGLRAAKSGVGELKKTVLVVPDFKDVAKQTLRATGQGGAETDFLLMNMETGRLEGPNEFAPGLLDENPHLRNYEGVANRVLTGEILYHPPYNGEPAATSQTIRALRTPTELPYSTLVDRDGALRREVDAIVEMNDLDKKTMEQAGKMQRNSRLNGAMNRLGRPPGDDFVAGLAARLREKHPKLVKTFLPSTPRDVATARLAKAPDGLRQALIPSEKLPKIVYHGVDNVAALPSISRNGLWVGRKDVNDGSTAVVGDGAYGSENYDFAKTNYAREHGIVIPLEIERDAKVLDLSKLDPATRRQLQTAADAKGIHLNLFLHDEYGIQAVKSTHWMFVDKGAFARPVRNYSDILKHYADNLSRTPAGARTFADVVNTWQLARYAELSGESGVDELLDRKKVRWDTLFGDSFGRNPKLDMSILMGLDPSELSPLAQRRIAQKLATPKMRLELSRLVWEKPERLESFLKGLGTSTDPLSVGLRAEVARELGSGRRLGGIVAKDPTKAVKMMNDPAVGKELRQAIRIMLNRDLPRASGLRQRLADQVVADVRKNPWGAATRLTPIDSLDSSLRRDVVSRLINEDPYQVTKLIRDEKLSAASRRFIRGELGRELSASETLRRRLGDQVTQEIKKSPMQLSARLDELDALGTDTNARTRTVATGVRRDVLTRMINDNPADVAKLSRSEKLNPNQRAAIRAELDRELTASEPLRRRLGDLLVQETRAGSASMTRAFDDLAALGADDPTRAVSSVRRSVIGQMLEENPGKMLDIAGDEKIGDSVRTPVRETIRSELGTNEAVRRRLADGIGREITTNASTAAKRLDQLTSLDAKAASKVMSDVPYARPVPLSSNGVFANGNLTEYGQWVLAKDPAQLASFTRSAPAGAISKAPSEVIDTLKHHGVEAERIVRLVGPERARAFVEVPARFQSNYTVDTVGGQSISNLTTEVFTQTRNGNVPDANQVETLRQHIRSGFVQDLSVLTTNERGRELIGRLLRDTEPSVRRVARIAERRARTVAETDLNKRVAASRLEQRQPSQFRMQLTSPHRSAQLNLSSETSRGLHPNQAVLDALTSDDPTVRSAFDAKVASDDAFREGVLRAVEMEGDTQHVRAFKWDPERNGDRLAMARMVDAQDRGLRVLDRRVEQLAQRQLSGEGVIAPTPRQLEERVTRLKQDQKIREYYARAELRAVRELPTLSPTQERIIRQTAATIAVADEARPVEIPADFCP